MLSLQLFLCFVLTNTAASQPNAPSPAPTHELDQFEAKVDAFSAEGTQEAYHQISEVWRKLYQIKLHLSSAKDPLEPINEDDTKRRQQASTLFYRASKKRALVIHQLANQENQNRKDQNLKDQKWWNWSAQYFRDIQLEILMIPQRWISIFELRWQKISDDFSRGLPGWLQIAKELGFLILFIFLGLLSYRLSSKLASWLNEKRKVYLRRGYRDPAAQQKALWLQGILPYVPWMGFLFFINGSESLFEQSYFSELAILFPYFRYYALYRLFRTLVNQVLSSPAFLGSYLFLFKNRSKILHTSKNLGLYLLISVGLLHTVRTAAGEGFVFWWMQFTLGWLNIFVAAVAAFYWREEFSAVNERLFTGRVCAVLNYCLLSPWSFALSLPATLVILLSLLIKRVYQWSERFEFVRSLSAEVFRKKVEGLNKKEVSAKKTLPIDYIEIFREARMNQDLIFSDVQKSIFESISDSLNDWNQDNNEEHIFGFVGEKGLGKTTLLRQVEAHAKSLGLPTLFISIEEKALDLDHFKKSLNLPAGEKVVVFLDRAENLFLSKVGGFEGFKAFLRYTQQTEEQDIFWCVGFNEHSWQYLQAVVNKNRYFNRIHKLNRWSEDHLKKLVLSLHKKTDFQRSFDKILMASTSESDFESEDYVENKYFRLLWEESLGNPSVALRVWLDSLSYLGEKRIRVGIPRDRSDSISGLPDDFYFVLAAIVRHENLSTDEIAMVSNFDEDLVVNAVKNCLEKNFVFEGKDHRISLNSLWQHSVYSTLKQKNFIYG